MLLQILVFLLTTLSVMALAYAHNTTVQRLRLRENRYMSIFYEDVVLRMQEATSTDCSFTKIRKLREAHASLETLAASVGGFDALQVAIDLDVEAIDKSINDAESALRTNVNFESLER